MSGAALPTDAQARKNAPMYRGLLRYFPRALAYVAEVSRIGNDQHNPGQPMHWAKGKSTDHGDCIVRHQCDAGTIDADAVRHSGKVAWRALAQLEIELEDAERGDRLAAEAPKPKPSLGPVSDQAKAAMSGPEWEAYRKAYQSPAPKPEPLKTGCIHAAYAKRTSLGAIICAGCSQVLASGDEHFIPIEEEDGA